MGRESGMKSASRVDVPHHPSRCLKIGFVPLIDCAPLVLAYEFGFFEEQGVVVELVREPGWATIRDKIAYGELDAAHALAGLCFAITWGLGVLPRPCLTGFLFNSHGDAITISSTLASQGVVDAPSLARWAAANGSQKRLSLAVPHRFSSHHFLLQQYLKPEGFLAERDYDLLILPPSQMNACLEAGHIDGYCVGEPFSTEAVQRQIGAILATSADLVPLHAEKALLVSKSFAEERPDEHRALVQGLSRACALCDSRSGRSTIAEVLSRPGYLGLDEGILRASLENERPEFHLFHGPNVNRPSRDKANWLVTQMRLAGMLGEAEAAMAEAPVPEIFREDLFEEMCRDASEPQSGTA